jgi:hypothetical protein
MLDNTIPFNIVLLSYNLAILELPHSDGGGVVVAMTMTMRFHVSRIARIGCYLCPVRQLLNRDIPIHLLTTLIFSCHDYCSAVLVSLQ